MQYTETQLSKLIEDVEREFTTHLAKAEEPALEVLAKAEGGEKKPPEKKEEPKPEGEAKPEAKPEAAAKPAAEAPPAQPGQEAAPASPEAAAKPAAPGQEAALNPPHEGHDYDEEDMEHMRKMYASMSESELKAHHDCIASLAKCGGGGAMMGKSEIKDENPDLNSKPKDKGEQLFNDKKNGGIEGCEPHNALGPKSPASDANGAKINKSEHDRRNGGKQEEQAPGKTPGAKSPASDANGDKMNKSEANPEVELLKSELSASNTKFEELKKNYDAVAAFLTKLVDKKVAPAAKAITSLDVIAKSEDGEDEKVLTKSEIDSALLKKSQDPTLKKSDRDAINAYYLSGVGINSISHLLK